MSRLLIRHRSLPSIEVSGGGLETATMVRKLVCERCHERPPTHEVKCDDPTAKWAGDYVVAVGAFYKQVCDTCRREVLGGL